MQVRSTEVDGVPVLWPSASGGQGRALLLFRSGVIDEPFVRSGWTHAVEHLALAPLGVRPHDYNGSVDLLTTAFVAAGDDESLVSFVAGVCRNLRQLPVERWEAERTVLAVEDAGGGAGDPARLLRYRYGATGPGKLCSPEWGRYAATGSDLAGWAVERFRRGNAVLCLPGPPPPRLRLDLPPGDRSPVPALQPVLGRGRTAVVHSDLAAVGVSVTVPADPQDLELLAMALRDRLLTRLRYDAALSYSPVTHRLQLDTATTELSLHVDCRPEDSPRVAAGLVEVLSEVARDGLTEQETAVLQERLRQGQVRSALTWQETVQAGVRQLLGGAVAAAPGNASSDPVAAFARGVQDALLEVPDAQAVPAGWSRVSGWSPRLPAGEARYREDDQAEPRRLVLTDEGIGLHVGPDQFTTVPWRECIGMAAWEDGTRLILGRDGIAVQVDPAHWPSGERAVQLIDQSVAVDLVAPQGLRQRDERELSRRARVAAERTAVHRAQQDVRAATLELGRARHRALSSLGLVVLVFGVLLLVLGGAVALVAAALGPVAAVAAPALLGLLLGFGYHSKGKTTSASEGSSAPS